MSVCKHNKGFRFLACTASDRLPGVWACNDPICEFSLNFNPETFPHGIAYIAEPEEGKVIKFAKGNQA